MTADLHTYVHLRRSLNTWEPQQLLTTTHTHTHAQTHSLSLSLSVDGIICDLGVLRGQGQTQAQGPGSGVRLRGQGPGSSCVWSFQTQMERLVWGPPGRISWGASGSSGFSPPFGTLTTQQSCFPPLWCSCRTWVLVAKHLFRLRTLHFLLAVAGGNILNNKWSNLNRTNCMSVWGALKPPVCPDSSREFQPRAKACTLRAHACPGSHMTEAGQMWSSVMMERWRRCSSDQLLQNIQN